MFRELFSGKKDVEKRFTEFPQYDDYILIIKDTFCRVKKDIYMMYYKNNNKAHIAKNFKLINYRIL